MKCPKCKAGNKKESVYCARCRRPLPGFWNPSLRWILQVLGAAYAFLAVFYLAVRSVL